MSWTLAIDFGTSSTSAAMARGALVEPVPVEGLPSILSTVFWHEPSHQLLLGEAADNAAALAPWCFEPYPKRRLGDEFMRLGDERVRVTDAVGAIMRRVAEEAVLLRAGERPAACRLTHPVRWGATRKTKLREAATIAGLPEAELVPEPVAAATHYAAEALTPGQHVAVYDLGGGTLDTAVLCRTDNDFVVVGQPGGREDLGGEDFDERLYLFLGQQLPEDAWARMRTAPLDGEGRIWARANRELRRRARRAKELLSSNSQVDVYIPAPVERDLVVTADQLNDMIRHDIEDSIGELERTIQSAGLKPSQLAAVYLAGGSSRMPLVADLIEQQLGVTPLHLDDPKAVVSLGAARGARAVPRRPPRRAEPVEETPQKDDRAKPPVESTGATTSVAATDPIPAERGRSQSSTTALASAALAAVGAVISMASLGFRGLQHYSGWTIGSGVVTGAKGSYRFYYPVGLTALGVLLLGLLGWGIRSGRRGPLVIAAGLAFALVGESLPLSFGPEFGAVHGGFWLGVAGSAMAAIGTVIACWSTDAGTPQSERTETSASLSLRSRMTLVLLGSLFLVISLFLPREKGHSTWNRVATSEILHWGRNYSIVVILLCGVILALAITGIRRNCRRALDGASWLTCLLLGEAFPLFYGGYKNLRIGFWLGVVGAVVTVVGVALVATATRRDADLTPGQNPV
jgi:hypothetical protein